MRALLILFAWFMNCVTIGHSDVQAQRAIAERLVHRILQDPNVPTHGQSSHLELVDESELPKQYIYSIHTEKNKHFTALDSCSIILDGDSINLMLTLSNQDVTEVFAEPDWNSQSKKWDIFVNKYWPMLLRYSDWKDAIAKYAPGRGTFSIKYIQRENDVTLKHLTLDIRLADGKIGGLNLIDYQQHFQRILNGKALPQPVHEDKILESVRKAFNKHDVLKNTLDLQLVEKYRGFSRMWTEQLTPNAGRWLYSLIVLSKLSNGTGLRVEAEFDEITTDTSIKNIQEASPSSKNYRPYTRVYDARPVWSKDDSLYFSTSRDIKGRPWWQRGSLVHSVAYHKIDNTPQAVALVRPIKEIYGDLSSYSNVLPSTSGEILAINIMDFKDRFAILNKNTGDLIFPNAVGIWNFGIDKDNIVQSYPVKINWSTKDYTWLSDDSGLILSLQKDRDLNLYWAQRQHDTKTFKITPLVTDIGDDILPTLNAKSTHIAWSNRFKANVNDKGRWQFVLGSIDFNKIIDILPAPKPNESIDPLDEMSKRNVTNRKSITLPGKPMSISWHSSKESWLVITESGDICWITDVDGKLILKQAKPIKWGNAILRPKSADISSFGYIAIAAELPKPQIYEEAECVVHSLIFLWDGQSEQVKPAYAPSLNGLPRFTFPNGSPWAKIIGDTKGFGLEGIADPTYFVEHRTDGER